MESAQERRWIALAGVVALLAALAITAAAIRFGPLNQDEGWYLYAALECVAGRLPYRDFFFTQGPLMPLVYGWLTPLWRDAGVLGGRIVTAALGLVGALLAGHLAARHAPREQRSMAGVIAFTLCACAVYHAYFMAIPKTYALTTLLFTGAFLSLGKLQGGPRWRMWLRAAGGGLLLALAAGVRLSFGAALAVVGVWLLWRWRRYGAAWFFFGCGGLLGLAMVYGPAISAAPEAFVFAQSFHTSRSGGGMMLLAGSVARLLRGYLPLAAAAALAGAWQYAVWCPRKNAPARPRRGGSVTIWLLAVAAVGGVHLLSPFPYDDYQVPLMPVAAAAVAVWLARLGGMEREASRARLATVFGVLVFSGMAALAAPQVQEWFVVRQDRFWPVMKKEPDLALLRRVGAALRVQQERESAPLLLTPDTYLAVESGRRVPSGLEMGPFGYFPDLETQKARRLLVLNRELLFDLLAHSAAPDAATSGYAWAIGAPAMLERPAEEQKAARETLAARYRLSGRVPDFGQGWTTLELWRLRDTGNGTERGYTGAKEFWTGDTARRDTGGAGPSPLQTGGADPGQGDGALPVGPDL